MAKNPRILCAEPGCTAETKPVKYYGKTMKGIYFECTGPEKHIRRDRIVEQYVQTANK